jgi:hypothetical protein
MRQLPPSEKIEIFVHERPFGIIVATLGGRCRLNLRQRKRGQSEQAFCRCLWRRYLPVSAPGWPMSPSLGASSPSHSSPPQEA